MLGGFRASCTLWSVTLFLYTPETCLTVTSYKICSTQKMGPSFNLDSNPKFATLILQTWKQTPFWAFEKPVGPLGCFLSKSCIKPKVKVSGSSSSSVIQDLPNSQNLLGLPGNIPLFEAFAKTVGPLVCVKSKHCIKQKVTSNWFYRGSLLFSKTSLTSLHSWRISIYVPKVWNR